MLSGSNVGYKCSLSVSLAWHKNTRWLLSSQRLSPRQMFSIWHRRTGSKGHKPGTEELPASTQQPLQASFPAPGPGPGQCVVVTVIILKAFLGHHQGHLIQVCRFIIQMVPGPRQVWNMEVGTIYLLGSLDALVLGKWVTADLPARRSCPMGRKSTLSQGWKKGQGRELWQPALSHPL